MAGAIVAHFAGKPKQSSSRSRRDTRELIALKRALFGMPTLNDEKRAIRDSSRAQGPVAVVSLSTGRE